MSKPDTLLWLSDSRGIYIPRDFAHSFADRAKCVAGVSDEDWLILEAGPDNNLYLDTWVDVCDHAVVTDEHGVKFRLHQDGDLWLIPEGMEWSDETDGYVWPDDVNPLNGETDEDGDAMGRMMGENK